MVARLTKFGIAGLINTAIGYGAIVAFLIAGMGPYMANFSGYLVGFSVSFVTNRYLAFGMVGSISLLEVFRFILAAGASFLLNLGVLHMGQSVFGQGSWVAQFVAVAAYAVAFYLLSAIFVFSERRR